MTIGSIVLWFIYGFLSFRKLKAKAVKKMNVNTNDQNSKIIPTVPNFQEKLQLTGQGTCD